MLKTLAPVFPAVEFPSGRSIRTVRVPAVAVAEIETLAVSVVPSASILMFATEIAASGVDAPRKLRSMAPVKFAPVTVILKLLPRAAALGLIAEITGTLATLAL
jgi:hypothetical protein